MKCPDGMIERVGYKAVRGSKAYVVKPTCVPDTGKPGKTPMSKRLPNVDRLDLVPYGYKDLANLTVEERHDALKKAVKSLSSKSGHDAAAKVMHFLNYLFVLTRNSQPKLGKMLEADRNWISKEYLGKEYSSSM